MAQDPSNRLYILDYGLFKVHDNGRVIGIPGYLIVTGRGEAILVDTGFPKAYADDPGAAALEDGLDGFGSVLELTKDNLPAAQLARLGLNPGDIRYLVVTHGDIDHVGGLADFPQATLVVGRAEVEAGPPRYFGDRRPVGWPGNSDLRLIDEDSELVPGVRLLVTPGHSPGHLSLLVRLASGPVVLTADALSRPAELTEGFGGASDPVQAKRSAERLLALARAEGARIIYGHDPAQWPTLPKAPAPYG